MLFLISPAKSLDYDTPVPAGLPHTLPQFLPQSRQLIEVLRQKTPADIASLMSLSDKLASLNVARYEAWSDRFTADNSRQAVLAFNGDVYDGLQARSLSAEDLQWAQQHLAILSGLYGVLRPLDQLQPYRLEMGTRLANPGGKDLYQFWGPQIADHLNQRLQADASPVVVNLAGVLQGRAAESTQGPGHRMCVRRLERRCLQDHQLPCQAGPRSDGTLRHHPPGPTAESARGL